MRFRGIQSSTLVLTSSLCLFGCGGSAGTAKSAASADEGAAQSRKDEDSRSRVLAPATAPSGVLVRMRVRNMADLADSVLEAAAVPLNWRSLIEGSATDTPYLKAIDWKSSIEGVVTMNLENPALPHDALSIGVTGILPVLAILEEENIVAVEGPEGAHFFSTEGRDCAVGPAIEGSAARVVCSDRSESLELLLPYVLRGLPREKLSDAAVHVEFEMAPLREAYGKELKTYLRWAPAYARSQHLGNATYDRALSDGAAALAREGAFLIDELQRFTVQVSHDSGDFTAKVELSFKGDQSDTVNIIKELGSRQGTAPSVFDALPSTASAAGYSREVGAERTGSWMSILADLLSGLAEHEGASRPFAKRVAAVVKSLGPAGNTAAFAQGPLELATAGPEKELRPAWVLTGTTGKKADLEKLFDDLGFLLASPDLKKLARGVQAMPTFKRKAVTLKSAPSATVYEWSMPPEYLVLARLFGAQMGTEVDSDELVGQMEKFTSGLVALYELNGATWISWGQNKEQLVRSFQVLANPKIEKAGTLGDLAGVRSESAASAGFSKLDGLAGFGSWLFPQTFVDDWGSVERALPGRGVTPLVYFFKVKEGAETTASWEIRVPAEFTQDLAALSVMLAQEKRKESAEALSE